MTIRQALWRVGPVPTKLAEASLPSESDLEDMIAVEPGMISDEWMLINRQEATSFGGRVDLLAIAPDASLVLIELKRGRTPRDVVAQAIEYASWVEHLDAAQISRIYDRFHPGRDIATDFLGRYGQVLDEESLNGTHQIVVVAATLDESTERIITYLNARGIAINVLAFQVFADPAGLLWSRVWLLDPIHTQPGVISGSSGPTEPWNGEYYVSFGHGPSRSWDDAVSYGFVSGGGGAWYSKTLQLLQPGDHIWVRAPGIGYVGVGTVTSEAVRASEFLVQSPGGLTPALEALRGGSYHAEFADDPGLLVDDPDLGWVGAVDWATQDRIRAYPSTGSGLVRTAT